MVSLSYGWSAAGETVRSVECGVVCTPDYPEVIVASYSGKVISFTTEPILARAADDNYGSCASFYSLKYS